MTLEKLKEYADEKNITIIDGALKNKKRRPNLLELKGKKAPKKGASFSLIKIHTCPKKSFALIFKKMTAIYSKNAVFSSVF